MLVQKLKAQEKEIENLKLQQQSKVFIELLLSDF
jgi:hypothetical protein